MNDGGWANERQGWRGFRFWPRSMVLEKRRFARLIWLKSLNFSPGLFRPWPHRETILLSDETISCFGADIWKQRMVIKPTRNGGQRRHQTGDSQMRTLSFILAFAFVLAPSVAGLSDPGLPGIGTFAYGGSPIATSVSQLVVVAAK